METIKRSRSYSKICLTKALHLSFGDKVLSWKIRRTFRGYWHPPGDVRCPFFQENNSVVFFNLLEKKTSSAPSQILSQPLYHNFSVPLCKTLTQSSGQTTKSTGVHLHPSPILPGVFSSALDRKSRHTTVLKNFGSGWLPSGSLTYPWLFTCIWGTFHPTLFYRICRAGLIHKPWNKDPYCWWFRIRRENHLGWC